VAHSLKATKKKGKGGNRLMDSFVGTLISFIKNKEKRKEKEAID